MIKVGRSRLVNGKKKMYSYAAVQFDKNGWADAALFLPADYDLVTMETKDNKVYSGWSRGRNWEGLRFEGKLQVERWKKNKEV